VPSPKSKKRSRKRRNSAAGPRAVASSRRVERAERQAVAASEVRRASRRTGREGERPPGPFGDVPVSEIAILIGAIGLVIGFVQGGGPVLIVGVVIVVLAVVEFTAREHFTGFRSHTTLLAAVPAVAVASLVAVIFGVPRQRGLLLAYAAPVFAVLFWLLRRKFATARQARVAGVGRRGPAA
jgi:hypothetical protein